MADFDSSLPVRTESAGDLEVKIVDGTTTTQKASVDSDGAVLVKAKLNDESGSAFSASNPLPVYVSDNEGSELVDFDQASSIASGSSANHSYAPSGNALKVKQVILSASGKARFEIKYGTTSSEASKIVVFNSTAEPSKTINLSSPATVADGTDTIIIVKKNLESSAQDLYSTIVGDLV
jgi:hypothetical protein